MTVQQLADKLQLNVLAGDGGLENQVDGGYICDLLSWVISHAQKGNVWITIQTNVNIVAVSTLTDVSCIILADGVQADNAAKARANQEDIPILSSEMGAYELAWKIEKLTGGGNKNG